MGFSYSISGGPLELESTGFGLSLKKRSTHESHNEKTCFQHR